MLKPSRFDEEFLGVRCFRLTPPVTSDDLQALAALAREGPFFADVKLPAGNVTVARDLVLSGFRQVCAQVQLRHDLHDAGPPDDPDVVIADRLALSATVIEQHAGNFVTSRYRQDALLDPRRATALYARWVENSTSGAKRVVHLGEDFCTFEDRGRERCVDLVSALTKRHGRGRRLMQTLIADARAKGLANARIVTEAENGAALGLYQRVGFQIETHYSCLHRVHP